MFLINGGLPNFFWFPLLIQTFLLINFFRDCEVHIVFQNYIPSFLLKGLRAATFGILH